MSKKTIKNRSYYLLHKKKILRQHKKWRKKNLAKVTAYQAKWRKEHPTYYKYQKHNYAIKHPIIHRRNRWKGQLKYLYGITIEDYKIMFTKQRGRCVICNKKQRKNRLGRKGLLFIDHCHKTGKVRGLLCQTCNSRLPIIDNPATRQNALNYLGIQLVRPK